MTATRVWATITEIPNQRAAVVECHDTAGNWLGTSRIDASRPYRLHPGAPDKATQDREAMYEAGYKWASHNATSHGGALDRYGWA